MNLFWSIIGIVAFALGACGLLLPILPTTPFWLLSAYCLMRGSQQLYRKAMSIALFNEIITNFRIYRAIPKHIKIISISTLWITIAISCIIIAKWPIAILLLIIAIGATWHILSYRTLTNEEREILKNKRRNNQ